MSRFSKYVINPAYIVDMLLTNRAALAFTFMLVSSLMSCRFLSDRTLDAFHEVNEGLDSANSRQRLANDSLFGKQDAAFYETTSQLRKACNSHIAYIDLLKKDLIALSGGEDSTTGELIGRDNIDVATRYMVDEGRGDTLLAKRNEVKRVLLTACIDDTTKRGIEELFQLPGKEKDWSKRMFNHVPATAAITILSKFENDCISGEGWVIESLMKKKH